MITKLHKLYNCLGIATAISLTLISCSLLQEPTATTPARMNLNLQQIESGTVINTVALIPMDIPNPSQPRIINSGTFRVTEDIKSSPGNTVLIPKNALITGIYSNDGQMCQISWQAIYYNYAALEKNQALVSIATRTDSSLCDPRMGIKPGQLVNITFTKANHGN